MPLTVDQEQLISEAKKVCGSFPLQTNSWASEQYSAGGVASAIRTASGSIYTGICIDMACGIGFCAESSAVSEMLKNRETHIVAAVAVSGERILPPCGRCREVFAQLDIRNFDASIVVTKDSVVTLRSLLPLHWLEENV
jgi:cytidine deaminase